MFHCRLLISLKQFRRSWNFVNINASVCYRIRISHNSSVSTLENLSPTQQALVTKRTNFLSKTLQCDEDQAKEIINRNIYILVKNEENVAKKASFLKQHFSLQDIMNYSELLTLPLGPIRHQYHTMEEFGFENINCQMLLDYCGLIGKPPLELIKLKHMSVSCDPLRSVLERLDLSEFSRIATGEFHKERYMSSPVLTLKRNLLPRFLAHIFGTSLEQARFIVSLHFDLSGASFKSMKECLDVLTDVYGFTIEEIQINPYLLHQDPSNLYKIAGLPSLMGGKTLETARKFPKVISKPVEDLLKIETLLREKGFKDDALQESRYVFTLSPETVQDLIIKRKIKKMVGR